MTEVVEQNEVNDLYEEFKPQTNYGLAELYCKYYLFIKNKEDLDFYTEFRENELKDIQLSLMYLLRHMSSNTKLIDTLNTNPF